MTELDGTSFGASITGPLGPDGLFEIEAEVDHLVLPPFGSRRLVANRYYLPEGDGQFSVPRRIEELGRPTSNARPTDTEIIRARLPLGSIIHHSDDTGHFGEDASNWFVSEKTVKRRGVVWRTIQVVVDMAAFQSSGRRLYCWEKRDGTRIQLEM